MTHQGFTCFRRSQWKRWAKVLELQGKSPRCLLTGFGFTSHRARMGKLCINFKSEILCQSYVLVCHQFVENKFYLHKIK